MKQTLAITRKEISNYFGSPMALIFLGTFLAAILFSVFWVDTFFARGIADVRPMFRWMPILLIFLVSALTMRQWSEEEQSGTMEILLTLPVRPIQLVIGKFLAVMALISVALGLTIFLPITVSLMGNLDWGPVVGGYIAALLMAAAYAAIGLYVSSRTANQIVALILSVLVGGLFYIIGTNGFTAFAGETVGNILRGLATGSRFESIERGVIDLRDLVYYLSLASFFLSLNVLSLDSKRWSISNQTLPYRRNAVLVTSLIALNLLALNLWLAPFNGIRLDLTSDKSYTLSPTTRDLLSNLQEPLLIRGYFSEKTHPLLAPLVPQIEDTLKEYAIASHGKVTVEFVDPQKNPDMEAEANQTYGIRPTPFQISGRYEASVVNSYFDILIRYGDQNVVLNFRDLIEVEPRNDGTVDVRLRNLEYDLTRSIKKVVYGFQSVDAVLAAMPQPAKLTLFVTPDTLPDGLKDAPDTVKQVAQKIADSSNGKFTFEMVNPDDPQAAVNRQDLQQKYGLQPIATSLFSPTSYYLHMVLQVGDKGQLIFPGGDFSEAEVRSAIESALKRSSGGFLKVVGVWTPPQQPTPNMFGQMQQPFSSWNTVQQQLGQDYEVRPVDLSNGTVPPEVDVLLVIAPQQMTDKARFAIDQYLMRGGSVVVAAGNYAVEPDQMSGTLALKPLDGGLQEMLASYGVDVQKSLVLDPQNEPFPLLVSRNLNGIPVQEVQAVNYPFFVDVRPNGMAKDNPIVANLPAVTMQWVSPLVVDESKNADRTVTVLLKSSPQSWLRSDTNIQPDMKAYPQLGFPVEGEQKSYPLAVAIQGSFESYFKGKESPLAAADTSAGDKNQAQPTATPAPADAVGVIESSPDTARLVVVGSAEFLDDTIFNISSRLTRDRYLNSLQFAQNAVDWSVEDLDLLSIRSRGSQAHVLHPMTEQQQSFWEMANYAIALLSLLAIGVIWNMRRRHETPMDLLPQPEYAELDEEVRHAHA